MKSAVSVKYIPVQTLLRGMRDGKFAIPDLQREFVWKPTQVCRLLDSIYRGLPVGAALVWEAPASQRGYIRQKSNIIPEFEGGQQTIQFLLDGQQRLTSLFMLVEGKPIDIWNGKSIHFGKFFYNWRPNSEMRFRFSAQGAMKDEFRVSDILSSSNHKRLKIDGKTLKKRSVAGFRDRFLSYKIPVIHIKHNKVGDIRETFIRINSGGTKISSADQAFSRATDVNLRDEVRRISEQLSRVRLGGIHRNAIVGAVALALGAPDLRTASRESIVRRLEKDAEFQDEFRKKLPLLREAIARAADYLLNQLGARSERFLPYPAMLGMLAVFFFERKNRRPDRAQKRQLRSWFWATGFGARYGGRGFLSNVAADVAFMRRMAAGKTVEFPIEEKISLSHLVRSRYGSSGALERAFYCLLLARGPMSFLNEESVHVEYAARSNRNDRHHFFPRAFLRRHKVSEKLTDSLMNIGFIAASDNQQFGGKSPASYLADFQGRKAWRRKLDSHLIPSRAEGPLLASSTGAGSYMRFLLERAGAAAIAINELCERQIFDLRSKTGV